MLKFLQLAAKMILNAIKQFEKIWLCWERLLFPGGFYVVKVKRSYEES